MGNLSTVSAEQNEENMNLKINMDLRKPILDDFKPLTNWSL